MYKSSKSANYASRHSSHSSRYITEQQSFNITREKKYRTRGLCECTCELLLNEDSWDVDENVAWTNTYRAEWERSRHESVRRHRNPVVSTIESWGCGSAAYHTALPIPVTSNHNLEAHEDLLSSARQRKNWPAPFRPRKWEHSREKWSVAYAHHVGVNANTCPDRMVKSYDDLTGPFAYLHGNCLLAGCYFWLWDCMYVEHMQVNWTRNSSWQLFVYVYVPVAAVYNLPPYDTSVQNQNPCSCFLPSMWCHIPYLGCE